MAGDFFGLVGIPHNEHSLSINGQLTMTQDLTGLW